MAKHDDHDREIPMPKMSLALLDLARDIYTAHCPAAGSQKMEAWANQAFDAAEAFMRVAVERGAVGPPEKT